MRCSAPTNHGVISRRGPEHANPTAPMDALLEFALRVGPVSAMTVTPTSKAVGAEVTGISPDDLVNDDSTVAAVTEALESNGVLVFPHLDLDPETQVGFCQKLGELDYSEGHHPLPGIYRVTRDVSKNSSAEYLKGTFHWHIDGCTPLHGEPPQKATVLSAKAVADSGGETEFASTYAAYDALTEGEKERFASLKVLHSLEASQRLVYPDPTPEQIAGWRSRPTSVHPLVWTHKSGRKSLLISAHAERIMEMDPDESRALLDELMDRATKEDLVYRHRWSAGMLTLWDNRCLLHTATGGYQGHQRLLWRITIGEQAAR